MSRARIGWIAVAALLCRGIAMSYFTYARLTSRATLAQPAPVGRAADPSAILAGPHVVFRNSGLGSYYGRLAAASLAEPNGPRAIFDVSCLRAYATSKAGTCLTARRGVVQTYGIATLDGELRAVRTGELVGLPSRVRMSADGSLVATTTFLTGHSYAAASFSTETIIRRDGKSLGNIETWPATVDGRPLTAVDRNFWGVTFAADDDSFYLTGASGSATWLMTGSIRKHSLTALRTDAECPSLSPDGGKVAYKKRLGNQSTGVWRLAVMDLATSRETLLAETRSADDQVEWLDNDRLLYALPRPGSDGTASDIWVVPADGSGTAQVFIEQASSPAVIR